MNNLMTFINHTENQEQIISLLKHNDIFGFVHRYIFDHHSIDFDGEKFVDEQNVLSLDDLKYFVNEAIKASLR